MNNEKFDRVIEFIHDHPKAHVQSTWIGRADYYEDDEFKCGSTGCIAGWAAMLNGWKPVWSSDYTTDANEVRKNGDKMSVRYAGQLELDLDNDQAEWMFDGSRELDDIERFGKALKDNPDMSTADWYEVEDDA